jgi:hypothetical protein
VLALMLSAAIAVAIALFREARASKRIPLASLFFWLVTAVFAYTLVDNAVERPHGVIIASCFIVGILLFSAIGRMLRATELRIEMLTFADEQSRTLWEEIRDKRVNLVPLRVVSTSSRNAKANLLRRNYRAAGPLAFLHVELNDDRSEFTGDLRARVRKDDGDYLIGVSGAVAIANAIAWISEELHPVALYLDLSLENPLQQAVKFLFLGEGEIGVLVHQILVRRWRSTAEDENRPHIFLVSP